MLSISQTIPGRPRWAVSDMGRYRKLAAERRMVNWRTRSERPRGSVIQGNLVNRRGLAIALFGRFPRAGGSFELPLVRV